jgi:hypothetical protein
MSLPKVLQKTLSQGLIPGYARIRSRRCDLVEGQNNSQSCKAKCY